MSVLPILVWLAVCGADPNLDASTQARPPGREVLGQSLLAAPLEADDSPDPSIRAQSMDPDPPEFVLASPYPRGIHRELLAERAQAPLRRD